MALTSSGVRTTDFWDGACHGNDIALNGREVGLFGVIGEMFESQNPAHFLQKIAY
jgi:hypothetical protein